MNEPREDDVGRWIRLAGRRPAPDPARARRVRASVQEVWLETVRRERRARRLRLAGGLAAAAALIGMLVAVAWHRTRPGDPPAWPDAPRIAAATGTVRVTDVDASPGPVAVGARVPWGASVETGADGRAALALPHGTSLRLDRATRARAAAPDTVTLERGALYVDTGAEGTVSSPTLTVRTPHGTVRDVGTRFEVRVEASEAGAVVRVRVRDGAVQLVDRNTERTRIVPRETAIAWGPDGFSATERVRPSDAVWDWTLRVAPTPEIDGKPLRSFLDWAAREGGWTLVFADVATAREAETVELGGSIAGLSVPAALEAVLPTCGMRHRVRDGKLEVRRETSP